MNPATKPDCENGAKSRAPATRYFDDLDLAGNLKRRSVRGGAMTLAAQAARFGIQLGSTAALARMLTPSDFGLVAMVTAIGGFLSILKELGLSMATVQSPTITHKQVNSLFWLNAALSAGLSGALVVLAPAVSLLYHEPKLTGVTAAMAAAYFLGGLTIQHRALLQRGMYFGILTGADLGSSLAGVATGLVLAAFGAGYWALVAIPLTTSLVSATALPLLCRWRPTWPRIDGGIKSMLSFGGYFTGFNLLSYASRNLDNVLIGSYWGPGPLGLYSRAYQLLLLPIQQINSPVTSVAIPALSRLQDQAESYRRAYMQTQDKLNLVVMPLVAFMMATADWIVRIVLGPQWTGVATIFVWLGFVGLISPVENTTGWLFVTQGRTKEMFHCEVITTTITILAFVAGLRFGPVWVAALYAVSSVCVRMPLVFWYVGRRGPVTSRNLYSTMGFPGALALVLLCALTLMRLATRGLGPLLGILLAIAISCAIVGAALFLIPQGRRRVTEVRQMIRHGLVSDGTGV